MSTFEVAAVAAITLCFVGFAVVLAWASWQTRNIPVPPGDVVQSQAKT